MKKLIIQMISLLLGMLTPDMLKSVVDAILDIVEDKVADSSNTIDDALVLPLCGLIRETFNIPDNDVPE